MAIDYAELIQRRHPLYERYVDAWDFLQAAYEGGDLYKRLALRKYSAEEDYNDFSERLGRSVASNHVKHVLDEKRNMLFKPGVARAVLTGGEGAKALWNEFNRNVDRRGTTRDDFFRRVYVQGTLFSWLGLLVDKNGTAGSRREQQQQRAFPYVALYRPQDILDWSVDQFGTLNWVLLRDSARMDADPKAKAELRREKYLLWTRDYWQEIVADYKIDPMSNMATIVPVGGAIPMPASWRKQEKPEKVKAGQEIAHGLGEVPLVIYRDGEHPSDPLIGDNALFEIADLSRRIFNLESNLDDQILNTVYSLLVIRGGEPKRSDQKVGTRIAFQMPEAAGGVDWVGADITAVQYILQVIDRCERTIYQKAKLRSGYGEEKRPERMSGTAFQWDWRITNDDVADDAREMERVEMAVDRLFGLYERTDGEAEFQTQVQYERNFSVASAGEMLQQWQMLLAAPLPDTAMREVAARTAQALLPRLDPKVKDLIVSEAQGMKFGQQEPKSIFRAGRGLGNELGVLNGASDRATQPQDQ